MFWNKKKYQPKYKVGDVIESNGALFAVLEIKNGAYELYEDGKSVIENVDAFSLDQQTRLWIEDKARVQQGKAFIEAVRK